MDPNAVHVSAAGEILDAYQQFLASLDIDLEYVYSSSDRLVNVR